MSAWLFGFVDSNVRHPFFFLDKCKTGFEFIMMCWCPLLSLSHTFSLSQQQQQQETREKKILQEMCGFVLQVL